MPNLQELNLERTGYKDCEPDEAIHISQLKQLKKMRIRSLSKTTVSFMLQALVEGDVQLDSLTLENIDVNKIIDDICKMQSVKHLKIGNSDENHVLRLSQELKNLEKVEFDSWNITFDVIRDVMKEPKQFTAATFKLCDKNIERFDGNLFDEIDALKQASTTELKVEFTLFERKLKEIPLHEVNFFIFYFVCAAGGN